MREARGLGPVRRRLPARERVGPDEATTAACVVVLIVLLALAWHRRWVADDAFIDLRVVSNLHHGLGPVWNPGERVEVFTSPAWVALVWALSSLLWFVRLEWVVVALGLAATLVGLGAAARGALLLWRRAGATGLGVPLGLLVLAALPPVWDFTTSGLETSLTFAWLGVSFWLLAVLNVDARRRVERVGWRRLLPRATPTTAALVVGLGPLVRPDLLIFAVGFGLLLVTGPAASSWVRRLRLLALALALPLAYEVFRMGYYAALEPNTALAKEASSADWARGWAYLEDFVDPYYLLIPLALLLLLAGYELRGRGGPRRILVVAVCPAICAALHALYIVRVGGDFMHARMLLPSAFGALLPVSVVVPSRRPLAIAAGVAILAWAVVCAAALRVPYADGVHGDHVNDERANYVAIARNPHPVTLHDYRRVGTVLASARLRSLARRRPSVVLAWPVAVPSRDPADRRPYRVVAPGKAVGLLGYAGGPDVHIVDQFGITDPLGARLRIAALRVPDGGLVPYRRFPGHDKFLSVEWMVARFAAPNAAPLPPWVSARWVGAARRAIACRPVHRLLTDIEGPLTAHRFLHNLADSFELDTLRFSPNPVRAARELCA